MNQMNKNQKFRPYFTASELTEVLRCVSKESQNLQLISYLRIFQAKITNEAVSVQYTTKPSIEDSLELGEPKEPILDFKTQRELAYSKWARNPSSCSMQELARAQMYRYENDLMTAEEEIEYQRKYGHA
jgi:hypothetical protein